MKMKEMVIVAFLIIPQLCVGQNNEYKLNELKHKRDSLNKVLTAIEKEVQKINYLIKDIEFLKTQNDLTRIIHFEDNKMGAKCYL